VRSGKIRLLWLVQRWCMLWRRRMLKERYWLIKYILHIG